MLGTPRTNVRLPEGRIDQRHSHNTMTMPSSTSTVPAEPDPLARSRRRTRVLALGASAMVLAALAWSLWPVSRTPLPGATSRSSSQGSRLAAPRSPSSSPLPIAHSPSPSSPFSAPLWVDPPKPIIAKAEPPPPPPPLRLQLLAIVSPISPTPSNAGSAPEEGVLRAVLYDQDADKLITVAVGDAVGARSISAIDADGVTIRLASGTQRLDLQRATMPQRGAQGRSSGSGPGVTTAAEDLASLLGRPLSRPQTSAAVPGKGVGP